MSKDDFFYITFKILSYLKTMEERGEEANEKEVNARILGVTQPRFIKILRRLADHDFICGFETSRTLDFDETIVGFSSLEITIEGLQYLKENSQMANAYKIAKELRDWVPFIW